MSSQFGQIRFLLFLLVVVSGCGNNVTLCEPATTAKSGITGHVVTSGCGTVMIDGECEELPEPLPSTSLWIRSSDQTCADAVMITSDDNGDFCVAVSPGLHEIYLVEGCIGQVFNVEVSSGIFSEVTVEIPQP